MSSQYSFMPLELKTLDDKLNMLTN
jgi:hypothetical protein